MVKIGALDNVAFDAGLYAYVGSAQRNLDQRVSRHLRRNKSLFWHIDYLLASNCAKVENVLFKNAEKVEECQVASLISKHGKQVEGFGCSDCSCRSHLFNLNRADFLFNSMQIFSCEKRK